MGLELDFTSVVVAVLAMAGLVLPAYLAARVKRAESASSTEQWQIQMILDEKKLEIERGEREIKQLRRALNRCRRAYAKVTGDPEFFDDE